MYDWKNFEFGSVCAFDLAHVKYDIWIKADQSTAVIPGRARQEKWLSHPELDWLFCIDSDAILHLNLKGRCHLFFVLLWIAKK